MFQNPNIFTSLKIQVEHFNQNTNWCKQNRLDIILPDKGQKSGTIIEVSYTVDVNISSKFTKTRTIVVNLSRNYRSCTLKKTSNLYLSWEMHLDMHLQIYTKPLNYFVFRRKMKNKLTQFCPSPFISGTVINCIQMILHPRFI